MILRTALLAMLGTLVACSSPTISLAPEAEFSADWANFEKIALRHGSIVSLPPFERSPQASLDAELQQSSPSGLLTLLRSSLKGLLTHAPDI